MSTNTELEKKNSHSWLLPSLSFLIPKFWRAEMPDNNNTRSNNSENNNEVMKTDDGAGDKPKEFTEISTTTNTASNFKLEELTKDNKPSVTETFLEKGDNEPPAKKKEEPCEQETAKLDELKKETVY